MNAKEEETAPRSMRSVRLPRHASAYRGTGVRVVRLLLLVLLLVLACAPQTVHAMKQKWTFDQEDRADFLIERFGFGDHGAMSVHVRDVQYTLQSGENEAQTQPQDVRAGLLFIHENVLWETMQFMQDARDGGSERYCVLQNRSSDMWIDFTDAATWNVDRKFADGMDALEPGFYYLFFAQCTKNLQISFHMDAEFRNGALNYLSVGDSPLPAVYLLMSLAFFAAAILWLRYLRANVNHIHNVHHMMTALVVCKTVSLFAESMRFYYMKTHGDTLTGWNEVYYVFMFLKGMMLFAVILLIGTGWSLLKPHLSTRDKYVIAVVLMLQVLSNTAMIVVEETSVGTRSWVTWRDMLHLVDILCCFAILLPIVWSIRNLRASAFTDGKAHINLQKLTQFRSFYLIVVTYIYFTRIALFLLTASLPYNATWVAVFMGELASVAFFSVTGYRFRPVMQNPYLEVATHIEALDEFSLDDDDDDMELQQIPVQRQDHLKYTAVKTNANGMKTAAAV